MKTIAKSAAATAKAGRTDAGAAIAGRKAAPPKRSHQAAPLDGRVVWVVSDVVSDNEQIVLVARETKRQAAAWALKAAKSWVPDNPAAAEVRDDKTFPDMLRVGVSTGRGFKLLFRLKRLVIGGDV